MPKPTSVIAAVQSALESFSARASFLPPDIAARFMVDCLNAFESAMDARKDYMLDLSVTFERFVDGLEWHSRDFLDVTRISRADMAVWEALAEAVRWGATRPTETSRNGRIEWDDAVQVGANFDASRILLWKLQPVDGKWHCASLSCTTYREGFLPPVTLTEAVESVFNVKLTQAGDGYVANNVAFTTTDLARLLKARSAHRLAVKSLTTPAAQPNDYRGADVDALTDEIAANQPLVKQDPPPEMPESGEPIQSLYYILKQLKAARVEGAGTGHTCQGREKAVAAAAAARMQPLPGPLVDPALLPVTEGPSAAAAALKRLPELPGMVNPASFRVTASPDAHWPAADAPTTVEEEQTALMTELREALLIYLKTWPGWNEDGRALDGYVHVIRAERGSRGPYPVNGPNAIESFDQHLYAWRGFRVPAWGKLFDGLKIAVRNGEVELQAPFKIMGVDGVALGTTDQSVSVTSKCANADCDEPTTANGLCRTCTDKERAVDWLDIDGHYHEITPGAPKEFAADVVTIISGKWIGETGKIIDRDADSVTVKVAGNAFVVDKYRVIPANEPEAAKARVIHAARKAEEQKAIDAAKRKAEQEASLPPTLECRMQEAQAILKEAWGEVHKRGLTINYNRDPGGSMFGDVESHIDKPESLIIRPRAEQEEAASKSDDKHCEHDFKMGSRTIFCTKCGEIERHLDRDGDARSTTES